jgi:hypothetical protein
MSRYSKAKKAINNLDFYKDFFDTRGVKNIKQYRTQSLKRFDVEKVPYIEKIWNSGDQFWKLANKHYGNPDMWYVIARFNNTPTEAHVSIGDKIKIPINLSQAMQVVV